MEKRKDSSTPAAAAAKHRRIQREQDQHDRSEPKSGGSKQSEAVQAGVWEQPATLPPQHLSKPGNESDLELEPRFLADDYQGSGKLENKVALITGGDSGIGRAGAVPTGVSASSPTGALRASAPAPAAAARCR